MRCVALEIDGIDDAQAWSVVAPGRVRAVTTVLGAEYDELRTVEIPLAHLTPSSTGSLTKSSD